jgi:hypothetical protein
MKRGIAEAVSDVIGVVFGEVVGWFFCLMLLWGIYTVSSHVAHSFGGDVQQEVVGLLSVITFVWQYEHRRADRRWARLREGQDDEGIRG